MKPTGVLRVLCAGGSTTFDSLADRNETTWPWRLEEELRARGIAVEVWNAGIPTWTTLENTIALLARDVDLKPDLLVLMQGFNDLQPACHHPYDPTYEHGHAGRMLSALGFELEKPGLLDRSVALERLRALVGRSRPHAEADDAGTLATAASEIGLATYRRNLRTLIAVARAHGIEVVLVTQPLRPSPVETSRDRRFLSEWLGLEADAVEGELAKVNRILLEVAAQEGTMAVDAVGEVSWQREDFWDPVHFATAGSDKFARLLADRLAGRLREVDTDPVPQPGRPHQRPALEDTG
ncbi:MAG: SGNH/GDSL hydrolase family protein [Acidobacteriota bacterium]